VLPKSEAEKPKALVLGNELVCDGATDEHSKSKSTSRSADADVDAVDETLAFFGIAHQNARRRVGRAACTHCEQMATDNPAVIVTSGFPGVCSSMGLFT
jgi:hypothetical protein